MVYVITKILDQKIKVGTNFQSEENISTGYLVQTSRVGIDNRSSGRYVNPGSASGLPILKFFAENKDDPNYPISRPFNSRLSIHLIQLFRHVIN